MNRKQLLTLGLVGIGSILLIGRNKSKYSKEDLYKIKKYKKYLTDKDFVVVTRRDYNKLSTNFNNLISLSSLHTYYSIVKYVTRYVL